MAGRQEESQFNSKTGQCALDRTALEKLRSLGGEVLVKKMIGLFESYARPLVKLAATDLAAGNLEGVERAAHSLKSSAGNVGAFKLKALAEEIEKLASENSAEPIRNIWPEFESAFRQAQEWLARESNPPA